LAATVIVPVVWAASLFGYCGVYSTVTGQEFALGAGAVGWIPQYTSQPQGRWVVFSESFPDGPHVQWLPALLRSPVPHSYAMPLWVPWLALAGLACWRWRADQMPPAHACCGCGYDRSGLAVGVQCPECGMVPTQ
jgi:hypothetical protein